MAEFFDPQMPVTLVGKDGATKTMTVEALLPIHLQIKILKRT